MAVHREIRGDRSVTARAFRAWLRDDRAAVLLFGLVGVVVIAWMYLLRGAGLEMRVEMGGSQVMQMAPAWTADYAVRVCFMWTVMMVAMMLPSVAPVILRIAGLTRKHSEQASGMPAAILFTAGYLVVWAGFSVAATLVQWGFDRAGILSEAMASRGAMAGGLILLAAGLYQLTPLKQTCLRQCRSPLDGLPPDWGRGARATVAAGMRHGYFSLGCCGVLMGLIFVGGAMNVPWIAGLALWMLVEQTLPWGSVVSRWTGVMLVAWGSAALTPVTF